MMQLLAEIARTHGTPCYVYDMDQVHARARELRQAFGGRFQISYAVKANPNPSLLRRMRGCADLLDVSSGGELLLALKTGWQSETLSFTGPGKRDCELELAVQRRIGEVIIESVPEAARLNRLAAEAGITQPVLIRVAPSKLPAGFGVKMAGKPCQFGVDEEELDGAIGQIRALSSLSIDGFHFYAGAQCLNSNAIAENYQNFLLIISRACREHSIAPLRCVFGSSMGIPYYDEDRPLDLAALAARTNPAIDQIKLDPIFANTRFTLEIGRFLVGEAGLYLTSIVSMKQSRGAQIAICDGGMNHHLAACGHMGTIIHRNYRMFKVSAVECLAVEKQPYDLVGPLCTSIDTLAREVQLPPLEVGDVIAIQSSGAYGLTASPIHFISHAAPREILIQTIEGARRIEEVSQLAGKAEAAMAQNT